MYACACPHSAKLESRIYGQRTEDNITGNVDSVQNDTCKLGGKRTNDSILQELGIKRELLGHVHKRKLSYRLGTLTEIMAARLLKL